MSGQLHLHQTVDRSVLGLHQPTDVLITVRGTAGDVEVKNLFYALIDDVAQLVGAHGLSLLELAEGGIVHLLLRPLPLEILHHFLLEAQGHDLKGYAVAVGARVVPEPYVGVLPGAVLVVVSKVLQTVFQFVRTVGLLTGVQLVHQHVSRPYRALAEELSQ